MRIVFFGTSDIAAASLEALLNAKGQNVMRVVTQSPKPKGRGQKIAPSPVKALAEERRLAVLEPKDLREEAFLDVLRKVNADLFVVCSYGRILPSELLAMPRIYTINLHLSLLPRYRGAAPIQWALINGETVTGVTIFKMTERLDCGKILLEKQIAIAESDTAATLSEKLSKLGSQALVEAIGLIEQEQAPLLAQDERKATLAPKLKKSDGLIDWKKPAREIHNRIRGLQPWPGAFTYHGKKLLKIIKAEAVALSESRAPGEIVAIEKQKGIIVQTGEGGLLLTSVQLEGKRVMTAQELIRGHKIEVGEILGKL